MTNYTAADWSKHEDEFTQMFYSQNTKQFWLPEEISLQGDLLP
ncbi:ribonucleotide-diphosphate reductase, partial [Bacillus pumilus]|nr:ribonucleotide-diphosphate reductase [Bacillus pumilus]